MRWTVAYVLLAERHQVRAIVPFVFTKEEAVSLEISFDRAQQVRPNFQAFEAKGTLCRSAADLITNLKVHDTLHHSPVFI
jgi:hypothetical protein